MNDSCRPSKLDPGLAAAYSMPRSRTVCTMRSDPGRVIRRAVAGGLTLPASRASCASVGLGALPVWACAVAFRCASTTGAVVTNAAAPVAALFKKPRRPTEFLGDFAIMFSLLAPCADRQDATRQL